MTTFCAIVLVGFFQTKLQLLLTVVHMTEYLSPIFVTLFVFGHPFSSLLFLFCFSLHLFVWYSGFQPFFLAPCFLHCQNFPSPLIVVTLTGSESPPPECFFFLHFKGSFYHCSLLHNPIHQFRHLVWHLTVFCFLHMCLLFSLQ